jgi:hypothetical protein
MDGRRGYWTDSEKVQNHGVFGAVRPDQCRAVNWDTVRDRPRTVCFSEHGIANCCSLCLWNRHYDNLHRHMHAWFDYRRLEAYNSWLMNQPLCDFNVNCHN